MNSITYGIAYILAILMVHVLTYSAGENQVTFIGPYSFSFSKFYEVMHLEITLKNIPPSVTAIFLIYSVKLNDHGNPSTGLLERVKVDQENIKNGEVTVPFRRILQYYNILVDVELETREGLWNKTRVVKGRHTNSFVWDYTVNSYVPWNANRNYDETGSCLAPKRCEIIIDFQNQCEEQLSCYYNAKKYICTLHEKLSNSITYLYQTNDDSSFIGGLLDTSATYTKLTIELESFDNNTSVNVVQWRNNIKDVRSDKKIFFEKDVDGPRPQVSFRDDYTYLEAVESFYKIHTTPKNWYDAKDKCYQEGTSLFYPENKNEVNAVLAYWTSITNLYYMYMGMSDIAQEGVFTTIDGKSASEVYNKWNYQQPDNANNNENCVHMNKQGTYNDIQCDIVYSFICKKSSLSLERNIQYNSITDNIIARLTYSETTEVEFSCKEYMSQPEKKYAFTALINTKDNQIKTLHGTIPKRKFKLADNGSVLCCLYYAYESINNGQELLITRLVVNKTLLIYQKIESMPPNHENSKDQAMMSSESNNYSWLIYVSVTFIGVSFVMLALYIIPKQRWFTNSRPVEERVEFSNHADQIQVIYADLDFVNKENQQRNENEESHYATIVGVLHPL